LSFDAGWLKVNKGFTEELTAWMTEVLGSHNDVFFLTEIQVQEQASIQEGNSHESQRQLFFSP
jgi:hypothetical protein